MHTGWKIAIGAAVLGGAGFLVYKHFFKMDITDKGLELLKQLEGDGSRIYRDTRGILTGGIGHVLTLIDFQKLGLTPDTAEHVPVPKKQIDSWADYDLTRFQNAVKDTIKRPLKPYQRDALLIFAHNVGETGFKTSSLARAVNNRANAIDIIKAFSMYHKPGLETRRAKEARLFLSGIYSNVLSKAELNNYFIAP